MSANQHNHTLAAAIQHIDPSMRRVLEFGVYSGATIQLTRNMLDESYKVFGFDTFTGLPEDWVGTDLKKGHFDMGGKFPTLKIDRGEIVFYTGLFSDTIPQYLKVEGNDKPIGLLHVDCDLYSSTVDIFTKLDHLIVKGTIIVFDDWHYNFNSKCNDHEQKAFYEWVWRTNRVFEFIDTGKHMALADTERKAVRILS
jgi:hypothetical protein